MFIAGSVPANGMPERGAAQPGRPGVRGRGGKELRTELPDWITNAERLQRAWGDMLGPVSDAARRVADAAVQGDLFFNAEVRTPVGRRDIQWAGPHHKHQEWPAQLNRFYWLAPL